MLSIFPLTERIVEVRDIRLELSDWINLRKYFELHLDCEEIINTEDSVVIVYKKQGMYDLDELSSIVSEFKTDTSDEIPEPRKVTIPIRYTEKDTDLTLLGDLLGLSIDSVIEIHSNCEYQLVMYGFIPGFAYLKGLDESLRLPRKATPSYNIKGGSVAIAENYTGIYPVDFQGGWYVIGFSDFRFLDRNPLQPGDIVLFKPL
jgi:KipI family sensor histidine kinase inhibitor